MSEIRSLIFGNVNHICLCWVRGHTGIIGNERADELAKSAADSTLPYAYNLCPISFFKKEIKQNIMQKWNSQWLDCPKGTLTKELFFPTIYSRVNCQHVVPNFVITQFLTGHGKFGHYLHGFKIKEDSMCQCGHENQTVQHLVFDCPLLWSDRYELESLLSITNCEFKIPLTEVITRNNTYKTFIIFLNRVFAKLQAWN